MGTMIEFARPDGGVTKGYLAIAGQGRSGVVVIQEWWGLNDQICGVADRFARAGYNALAPDLYEGRVTTEPDKANHLMTGLDFTGATHQDLRKEFADPAKIRVPLQGHFANKDDWCTPAAVDDLERALKEAGAKHEIYRNQAAHAFANERSAAYDVACANLAWERMAAFLQVHIA